MNQQLLNSLTATLLITALGTATSTCAQQSPAISRSFETTSSPSESSAPAGTGSAREALTAPENQLGETSKVSSSNLAPSGEAVKVGEYRSPTSNSEAIAKVHPHSLGNRSAATLYVRNIPVLTFLGSGTPSVTAPTTGDPANPVAASSPSIKIGARQDIPVAQVALKSKQATNETASYENDPVWRATAIAATLNQLNRDSLDASAIKVIWDTNQSAYLIKIDGRSLVKIDSGTTLADSTNDAARDALQATNRLRRLMGDADPLTEIEGQPKPKQQKPPVETIQLAFRGWASWYGPGFNGNFSASGEVFNQHALTAAHRDLPFGTRVRVTNLDNGRSVVVRINDRGPYLRDRVIDLSMGAAQVIGLLQSGVAPVKVDVLGPNSTASSRR